MSSQVTGPKLQILFPIALLAVVAIFVLILLGAIGAIKLTDGCLYRYNVNGGGVNDYAVAKVVNLRADSNYSIVTNPTPGAANTPDPAGYGKWVNTGLKVTAAQTLKLSVKGEISLCRAYVPSNNLQSASNLDNSSKKIPIPRVEEYSSDPVSLIFNASTGEWRNITQLFKGDKLIVSVTKEKVPIYASDGVTVINNVASSQQYNYFTKTNQSTDCREGKLGYSPICGRYSIYRGSYISHCTSYPCSCNCVTKIQCRYVGSSWMDPGDTFYSACMGTAGTQQQNVPVCQVCTCWNTTTSTMPQPYLNNGSRNFAWGSTLSALIKNYNQACSDSNSATINNGNYKFWYSATDVSGLLYRLNALESPADKTLRGSYNIVAVAADQTYYSNMNNSNYTIIFNSNPVTTTPQYLQFRFINDDGTFANNTGGYVLNIKQTKCRRTNGSSATDTYTNRGQVQYAVLDPSSDPNNTPVTASVIVPDTNGVGQIITTANGNLWMKINNDPNDYQDSFGQYNVTISTTEVVGDFTLLVLDPLFKNFKDKIRSTAVTIFQNMTCYNNPSSPTPSCINFFNYIKAILILYISIYAMMFLLGMVQISQRDIVERVIKIAIVSGLMNQKTFNYFNTYVFDFVTGFSDQIIANMSGYSLFTSTATVTNPFKFMDAVLSKILFSTTFYAQLMALFSMGLAGILYFIIVIIAVIIVLIVAFRAIGVYIMAFLFVAILIGLAPLFLSFMLFNTTRYLFDNWVKFTIRYMLEPLILMAGIIILTQLFTIYLDFVIGYSVCWKCAIPIKIPFPSIPGLSAAFMNVELFCINWFGPWGLDSRSGSLALNMQHIISLMMIAYCMYGYIELSSQMVTRLSGTIAPSATEAGGQMTSAIETTVAEASGLDAQTRDQIAKEAKGRLSGQKGAGEGDKKGAENKGDPSMSDKATSKLPDEGK